MHSFLRLAALASACATVLAQSSVGVQNHGSNDPVITIVNKSSQRDVLVVQTNAGVPSTAYHGDPITVEAGDSVNFYPGAGFCGALTSSNGEGTRHEVDFSQSDSTWYDCDMEMGMDDSTLGLSNGETEYGGRNTLVGEANCVGKANQAWGSVPSSTKQQLLSTGYIQGSAGSITSLKMNKQAPASVITFLQQTAKFNAYITHGSVGGTDATKSDTVADAQTRTNPSNKLTLTKYA